MSKVKLLFFYWVATLFLSACGFNAAAPIATFDVNNAIVQTAAAAQSQTAQSLPSQTSTITPTFSLDLITEKLNETQIPLETTDPNYQSEITQYGFVPDLPDNVDYSSEPWSCIGDGRYPPKGAILPAGEPFVATWRVINNGQKDWNQNAIDFVYRSGYLPDGSLIKDLDRFVASGNKATFQVKFIAPKTKGVYRSVWDIRVGSKSFCGIQFEFEIAKSKPKN